MLNVLLRCLNERFMGPIALIALKGIRVMIRHSIMSTGVVARRRRWTMKMKKRMKRRRVTKKPAVIRPFQGTVPGSE